MDKELQALYKERFSIKIKLPLAATIEEREQLRDRYAELTKKITSIEAVDPQTLAVD